MQLDFSDTEDTNDRDELSLVKSNTMKDAGNSKPAMSMKKFKKCKKPYRETSKDVIVQPSCSPAAAVIADQPKVVPIDQPTTFTAANELTLSPTTVDAMTDTTNQAKHCT